MCVVDQADCGGWRCQLSIAVCQGFAMATGYQRHATRVTSRDNCAAADCLRHPRVCHGWGVMSYGDFRHGVPRLFFISGCLGPTHVSTPRFIIYRGPITASKCEGSSRGLTTTGCSDRED